MRRSLLFGLDFAIAAALQWGGFVNAALSTVMWFVASVIGVALVVTSDAVAPRLRTWGGRNQLLSTVIACVLGAMIFGIAWHAFLRASASTAQTNPPPAATPEAAPEPFNLAVRSIAISSAPGPLSLFMVRYHSVLGDTISPIFILANLRVTNLRGIPVVIERYSFAVSDTAEGPWLELLPMSLSMYRLYALGITTAGTGSITIPRGAYRLATAMKAKDLHSAALLDPAPALDVELAKAIPPHTTISGWAAFDSPRGSARSVPNHMRITVKDTTGTVFTSVLGTPRSKQGDTDYDAQPGQIAKTGTLESLKAAKVRFYGDPYPERLKHNR